MSMKLKRYEINNLNDILSGSGFNTSKMGLESAMKVVILKTKVTKFAEEVENTRKEFVKTNTTEEHKTLSEKEKDSLTEEEEKKLMELNKKLNDKFIPAFTTYLNEEVDFEFDKLSTEDFKKLMESNNDNSNKIDINHYGLLFKYIVDTEIKEEKKEESK